MWYNKVVGQQKIKDDLHASISNDTLSHAMIIEGPSGYGGLPLALSIAQTLLCTNVQENKACEACKGCQQVQQLIHPDLHIAYPVVKKDGIERKNTTAKDFMKIWRTQVLENPYVTYNEWLRSIAKTSANGDINVKECNEIIQQLNFQAFSGGKKIQLIWIADKLGGNGNKLLKLIEEPPPETFIILICDNLDLILGTIQSRCRIIRLPRILEEDIASALAVHSGIEDEAGQQIAYICDGDFSLALEYSQLEQNNLMDICLQWMDLCKNGDIAGIRKWSLAFNKFNIEEQKAILNYFLKVLQSVLYYQLFGESYIKLSRVDKQQLLSNSIIQILQPESIDELSKLVAQMISQIERYVNSRMVMFDACLKSGQIFRN